jgi:uncharacterized membrane protein YphA (DoxX/SURF4 family)
VPTALRFGARGVLAVVFLLAAVAKITDPQAFADRLLLHSPLSPGLANGVVAVLPWLELTCGLCLAVGYAVREAAVLVGIMLLAFVAFTLLTPAEQDCGCLVLPVTRPIGRGWHVAGDLLLLLCCVAVVRDRRPNKDKTEPEA